MIICYSLLNLFIKHINRQYLNQTVTEDRNDRITLHEKGGVQHLLILVPIKVNIKKKDIVEICGMLNVWYVKWVNRTHLTY